MLRPLTSRNLRSSPDSAALKSKECCSLGPKYGTSSFRVVATLHVISMMDVFMHTMDVLMYVLSTYA